MTRGPVAEFAAELRALRRAAGTPTYRTLARQANYSITVLSQAAAGVTVPAWPAVKAFVVACGGDPLDWEQRWQTMRRDQDIHDTIVNQPPPSEPQASDAFQIVRSAQDRQISSEMAGSKMVASSFGPSICTRADTTAVVKVFLLDDHELVRTGLRALIESQPDMAVVGEAATAAEARTRLPLTRPRPDVAILDIRLPDEDGISVCRFARTTMESAPTCLMLTSYADDDAVVASMNAGAAGFLLKDTRAEDLLKAIRLLAAGGTLLNPDVLNLAIGRLRKRNQGLLDLTEREREIFDLLGEGMSNDEIARQLLVSPQTIATFTHRIMQKQGFGRRQELVVTAARLLERRRNRADAQELADRLTAVYSVKDQ
ncbi:response regulator [Amycolatopsis thailandensis]|nr:response regulator [Amycolatopsis thailandensis]